MEKSFFWDFKKNLHLHNEPKVLQYACQACSRWCNFVRTYRRIQICSLPVAAKPKRSHKLKKFRRSLTSTIILHTLKFSIDCCQILLALGTAECLIKVWQWLLQIALTCVSISIRVAYATIVALLHKLFILPVYTAEKMFVILKDYIPGRWLAV